MPKINVEKPFPFSPDGKSVVEVEAGEQEVSERCAEVAVKHLKVATLIGEEGGGKAKTATKAKTDNKAKAGEQPPATEGTNE